MTYRDATTERLRGRWSASAELPGMYERTVTVRGVTTPVKLVSQLLPKNKLQLQWHCIAYAGATLLGEGYGYKQAQAAHNAIHHMLGDLPTE
jgi:hypothetical protein